jgi:hypothetical protein
MKQRCTFTDPEPLIRIHVLTPDGYRCKAKVEIQPPVLLYASCMNELSAHPPSGKW